ncbi:DUF3054 domain-containing protein [Rhodococcus sp. BP-252]|uniref:DUF3054 domain-containing protein n=1 Tax=unclassified Rhodococcus (in: high G+C Gram-positive bacteria) TaxID=192944 RepID=UPI001C9A8260|nr:MULTISPECIES: DUF3054 domain-containing protein [unclassified Rhodococcus (in: high G+C Gram-positive bacteria)]MBY6412947.1 DUF3054 domain-containing protein [Rhodococcus sp. BP-320]MBY6419451.1 DUF3054 domain-containing protein [Rhodococcus sp. BP-321]MBY6423859.1 DUF3054 domain-containing protein [Rhodococcus sp. BP-324]MBY6429131.1 DUF3054 domain-containing protein [Rhodococcus sp. BP-323]MBY6432869.1 DUF3054 domain-containing protein [Rhodococcus sp. BP-322]
MNKRSPIIAAVVDLVLVLVFCAIGRRSHDEANVMAGLFHTAWPFVVGAVIGWIATVTLYRDKFDAFLVLPTGILVWVSTVLVGMILRVVSGQGTAFSFIVVASTVLAVFLLGWRALAKLVPVSKN